MLEELRRQFDEIRRHAGSRKQRIGDVRQQAMEGVAEFMEQGARIVEAQERRLALGSFREIHHVDDDRTDLAGQSLLRPEGAHPGAAALGRASKVIADEGSDLGAVRVNDAPCANVRMIVWEILQFREFEGQTGDAPSRTPPRRSGRAGSRF